MGVEVVSLKAGNGVDKPKTGDEVTIQYTGNLYDPSAGADNFFRGKVFDSSDTRGDFKTKIGVSHVIKGWDEGVPKMTLGEKAVLTISRGFYDLIPPNSTLVFTVELKAINGKTT